MKAGSFKAWLSVDTSIEADNEIHVLVDGTPRASEQNKDVQISWYPNGLEATLMTADGVLVTDADLRLEDNTLKFRLPDIFHGREVHITIIPK